MAKAKKAMRTSKGNVTEKARDKTAAVSGGRFPIFDAQSARAALLLRGHATTETERNKIIAKAAKFLPEMAKQGKTSVKNGLSVQQIEYFSGLSRITIYRGLREGMAAGAVKKEDKRYRISGSMNALKDFLSHYSLHLAAERLKEISGGSGTGKQHLTLQFVSGREFIFSAPSDFRIPNYPHLFATAFTALEEDNLDFLTNLEYFHYRPTSNPSRIEDHALDMILIDPLSSRNKLYTLLYLKKNIERIKSVYLYSLGEVFGLRKEVIEMMEFLESKTKRDISAVSEELKRSDFLPSYNEFKKLCELYGVDTR